MRDAHAVGLPPAPWRHSAARLRGRPRRLNAVMGLGCAGCHARCAARHALPYPGGGLERLGQMIELLFAGHEDFRQLVDDRLWRAYILRSSLCTASPSMALISSLISWLPAASAGSFAAAMNASGRILTRSCRHTLRHHIGPPHCQRGDGQLHFLTMFLRFRKIENERDVRQVGMLFKRDLHEQRDLLVAHPMRWLFARRCRMGRPLPAPLHAAWRARSAACSCSRKRCGIASRAMSSSSAR